MSKAERQLSHRIRNARRLLLYHLYVLTWLVLRIMPVRLAQGFMEFIAGLAYLLVPKQRRIVLRNLATGLPEFSIKRRRSIARRMYRNLALNVAEFASLRNLRDSGKFSNLVEVEGEEYLAKLRAEGRGALALTGHIGNWELLAAAIAARGYRLTVFARKMSDEALGGFVNHIRERCGVRTLDRTNTREILRRLGQGHLIGILPDQDIPKLNGVFVEFLGTPAYTPTGLVSISLKTGVPIVPVFIARKTDGTHRVTIHPPLELIRTGRKEWDILRNTMRYTAVIESEVRKHPEQWMWFHNRWRTRPAAGFLQVSAGTEDGRAS